MADLDANEASLNTKITGSDSDGLESYFVDATSLNELKTYSRLNQEQMIEIKCLLEDIRKELRENNMLLRAIGR